MEPQSIANYSPAPGPSSSKLYLFEDHASSSSSPSSSHQKRKWNQVVPHDGGEINGDDHPTGTVIDGESSSKNKQPMEHDMGWHAVKDAFSDDIVGSSQSLGDNAQDYGLNDLDADAMDYSYSEDNDYDYNEDNDDEYQYDDDDDFLDAGNDYNLAAKFDDMDLPAGVEATVPWLQKPAPEAEKEIKPMALIEDEIKIKYNEFKQFDTVSDHSDHHFCNPEVVKAKLTRRPVSSDRTRGKDWVKRIQHEWKVLEKDLPESIYVRTYEERMDILRAAIVGPRGTPYHNGLFFFDVLFPVDYPNAPPLVHYHSGGLRINPNLYNCGKVCLSLLGTWEGKGCERWNPLQSTMLQVLVSIQALILNEKPYFNEPGYASSANTPQGEKASLRYNEDTFLLSCKTMLYSLRRPPKHFEDLVAGHFRKYGKTILRACRAYMAGALVGSNVDAYELGDEGESSRITTFKSGLKKLYEDLLMEFTVKGADCKDFLAHKIKTGKAAREANNELKQFPFLMPENKF